MQRTNNEKRTAKEQQEPQDGFSDHRARSLDTTQRESSETGDVSLGFGGIDSQRGSSNRGDRTKRTAGGILRQLKQIKEAHLAYVNAHTERLRARLAEDEQHRQQIIDDIDQLGQEIVELLEDE